MRPMLKELAKDIFIGAVFAGVVVGAVLGVLYWCGWILGYIG